MKAQSMAKIMAALSGSINERWAGGISEEIN
jgi:hypothetical protein